jgi:ADP-ribose pyrophosphatase
MKVPAAGKQVFRGKIFDVYQWDQKLYNGSTTTFEMLKRPDTVQVIPVVGDKIWMSYESQPNDVMHDSFFGGRVEKDEKPLASAKRELLEESGLHSNDWILFKSYEPFHKIEWRIYYFIARNCTKIQEQHLDAGEKISIVELNFKDFVDKITNRTFDCNHFSYELLHLKNNPQELLEFKRLLYDKIER